MPVGRRRSLAIDGHQMQSSRPSGLPRLVCRTGHHTNSALKANAVRRHRAGNPVEGNMHLRTHGPTLGDNTVKCRVPRRDVRLPLNHRSKRVSACVDDLVPRLEVRDFVVERGAPQKRARIRARVATFIGRSHHLRSSGYGEPFREGDLDGLTVRLRLRAY